MGDHNRNALSPEAEAAIDSLCDRFEREWLDNRQPSIGDYLEQGPVEVWSRLLRDLLAVEVFYRRARGERPLTRDYAGRFPEHGQVVGEVLGQPPPASVPASDYPALEDLRTRLRHPLHRANPFTVGRRADASLPLNDLHCARYQFQLDHDGVAWFLEPVSVSVPTRCEGTAVQNRARLRHCALIEAGPSRFRYLDAPADPLPVEAGVEVVLKVEAGPHAGESFTIREPGSFLVGRSARADFRLRHDRRASRTHFFVDVDPPRYRLLDARSRTGTFLGDQRVGRAGQDLNHGDVVRAGESRIRVSIRNNVLDLPTVPLPSPPALPPPTNPCLNCETPMTPGGLVCPQCRQEARRKAQPIPGYHLLRELGRGGMAVVHLALHKPGQPDESLVAVKTIQEATARTGAVERFLREAAILSQLDHPHIVRFREMGAPAGKLFLAMDYVHGIDAAKLLRARGPLAISAAVQLIDQVLQALEYAHELGREFVHRDIKPGNVLIEGRDETGKARLADFGLARQYEVSQLSNLTQEGEVGGTLAFMPPEQITEFREVGPPADLYSTAATLYNLLTGSCPHDLPQGPGTFEAQVNMILNQEPIPIRQRRRDLPSALARVVHQALAHDPEDRFPDAAAFRQALAGLVR